jgi:hypothetical protein
MVFSKTLTNGDGNREDDSDSVAQVFRLGTPPRRLRLGARSSRRLLFHFRAGQGSLPMPLTVRAAMIAARAR